MFPGGDPRQMRQMMQKLGIEMNQLEDVEQVIIERKDSKMVFDDVQVTQMEAKGQTIFQVVGEPKKVDKGYKPSKEDIELVVEQTDASEEEAREALIAAEGDIADAIMELS